ncbi:ABC transporter ATP-binding protein [Frigoribacterium sp. PvP032]|uniref:ABC transporter ATP-binding protein n=1 Tax=Frigoribacterium sp. PvP032 TaxID=2806589 RepID=UPI001B3F6D6E|nr:ABC transporter ATP-binding protein [Frigoribacterium sp. PvP032]MBP1191372.1 ABC-2 type transport system ATP-binding protein [Frigoribacterium sp. PvP032]
MASARDDQEGALHPDEPTRSGGDTLHRGDQMDDEATPTGVPDEVATVDEPGRGAGAARDRTPTRGGASAAPRSPRTTSAGRKPASTRTAADRSAAAKKAAATRAANARARAAAATAAAAEEAAAAEVAAQQAALAEEAVAELDETLPDEAVSDETASAETVPDETASDETVPDETLPDESVPDETVSDETVSDETVSDETVPDETPADDVVPAGAVDEVLEQPAPDAGDREADAVDDVAGPDEAATPPADDAERPVVLSIKGIVKRYGSTVAVEGVDLDVRAGSFYGIVGPNGAGKTTTLSIVTGLLRPDEGTVSVLGSDVWSDPAAAKRALGVLPDRLRLFDRLTGAQLLYYSATLRGLDGATARKRSADLAAAFGLQDALGRLVADYSVGMTKKIALAAAVIHSPRVLVLDEPFESVDPVSAATVTDVLQRYVAGGGTVLLSSHSMDLVERICDSVAVIVDGHVLASGTVDEVRAGRSLEQTFVELAGGRAVTEGMEWLQSFSD